MKPNTQVTGNIGMYYVSYRLSTLGYNVLATARNAKGIDLVVYNETATKMLGIQVKCLAKKNTAIPLGKHENLDHLIGEVWTVVVLNGEERPNTYVLTLDEIKAAAHQQTKDSSWWVNYKKFAKPEYLERWNLVSDRL